MPAYKSSADALWFMGDLVHCCGWVVAAAFIIAMIFSAHQGVTGSGDGIVILLLFPVFIFGLGWAFRHFVRKMALKIYWRTAMGGDASAQNWLGHAYANGRGVQKDLAEAIAWWRKAADQGFADAQYELARRYETGLGTQKDFANTTALYEKAAEQGHLYAQKRLDKLIVKDPGITAVKKADQFLRRSNTVFWGCLAGTVLILRSGFLNAPIVDFDRFHNIPNQGRFLLLVAVMAASSLVAGWVLRYELRRVALKRYTEAANEGNPKAQFRLGWLCDAGVGVVLDLDAAIEWFRRAAEAGDANAQFELGRRYETGVGVSPDMVTAIHWYERAANQGDASSAANLAEIFAKGQSGSIDPDKAKYWGQRYLANANHLAGERSSRGSTGSIAGSIVAGSFLFLLITFIAQILFFLTEIPISDDADNWVTLFFYFLEYIFIGVIGVAFFISTYLGKRKRLEAKFYISNPFIESLAYSFCAVFLVETPIYSFILILPWLS